MKFTQFIKNLHREESGQDLLEYALVLIAILGVVVTGSNSLAGTIAAGIASINTQIKTLVP